MAATLALSLRTGVMQYTSELLGYREELDSKFRGPRCSVEINVFELGDTLPYHISYPRLLTSLYEGFLYKYKRTKWFAYIL